MGISENVTKGFVDVTLENWRTSPFSQWAFHHVREVVPTAEIQNDPQAVWTLNAQAAPFNTAALTSLINETSTDAVVIMQDDKLIFESYHNGMRPDDPHIIFSVSKSILGLIAGLLIRDDIIKDTDLMTDYLPEMLGTAYDRATIRDALDMRVGVCFDEDYTAQDGPIIDYRYAANWNPTPDPKSGITLKSFSPPLSRAMVHMVEIFIMFLPIPTCWLGFLNGRLENGTLICCQSIYGNRWALKGRPILP